MREVKYRAWNEYAKTMYDVDLLHIRNTTPQVIPTLEGAYMSLIYQPKVVLMQWTGLKDREQVDVYEDDILELYDGQRYVVKYQPRWGGYELDGLLDRQTLGDKISDWDAKVIGNIHQHKELLNGR